MDGRAARGGVAGERLYAPSADGTLLEREVWRSGRRAWDLRFTVEAVPLTMATCQPTARYSSARCGSNSAHIRQARSDFDRGSQEKALNTF